jgi:hypothetical protein
MLVERLYVLTIWDDITVWRNFWDAHTQIVSLLNVMEPTKLNLNSTEYEDAVITELHITDKGLSKVYVIFSNNKPVALATTECVALAISSRFEYPQQIKWMLRKIR